MINDKVMLKDCETKKTATADGNKMDKGGTIVLKHGMIILFANMEEHFVVNAPPTVEEEVVWDGKQNETSSATGRTSKPEKKKIDTANMTARQIREAEIKAMMDSLDDSQTYTKYVPTKEERKEKEVRSLFGPRETQ